MEEFFKVILSEYGAFVGFLVVNNAILLYIIKLLWNHNTQLGGKLIDLIGTNVKVLTDITNKLDNAEHH